MLDKELVQALNRQVGTDLPGNIATDELRNRLAIYINDLIINDFQKLVNILYRIDVDEKKLKSILNTEPGRDAADIITGLIIERELQKIETRKKFKK